VTFYVNFRVEPSVLHSLAGQLRAVVTDFDDLGAIGLDLGGTGDPALARALENFVEWSREQLGEIKGQLGQLQEVIEKTAEGYEAVDTHVVSEIQQDLSNAGGPAGSAL
jgi:hypothetical protein